MHKKNIPNQLTVLRFILAAGLFLVLSLYQYGQADAHWMLILAIVLFIIAAITDALDGHLARKWQVISQFGRIIDPTADKILIIGAMVCLAGPRFVIPERAAAGDWACMVSGVYPWMVIVMLLREMLVTGIRAELESQGVQFPANVWGKLKMILQCIVVPIVLLIVIIDPVQHVWAAWVRDVLVWVTVIVTLISGWPYVTRALATAKG